MIAPSYVAMMSMRVAMRMRPTRRTLVTMLPAT